MGRPRRWFSRPRYLAVRYRGFPFVGVHSGASYPAGRLAYMGWIQGRLFGYVVLVVGEVKVDADRLRRIEVRRIVVRRADIDRINVGGGIKRAL